MAKKKTNEKSGVLTVSHCVSFLTACFSLKKLKEVQKFYHAVYGSYIVFHVNYKYILLLLEKLYSDWVMYFQNTVPKKEALSIYELLQNCFMDY